MHLFSGANVSFSFHHASFNNRLDQSVVTYVDKYNDPASTSFCCLVFDEIINHRLNYSQLG